MGIREDVLALADELEGMDVREGCRSCPADGTKDCRGDLSCEEAVARAAARRVREIIEHDECEVTTVSAYDLLSEEDREALAWVREMGGANALSRGFQDADNRRIELCSSLGIDLETGWADAMVAMRRRLMPEGMEWPKVDGKPVDFKTAYGPSLGVLEAVSIYNTGACQVMSHDGIVKNTTEIHVFKPKVLDADGVEIRAGDEVYIASYGDGPWTVTKITTTHAWHVYGHSDELGSLDMQPNLLTHRAPVLAADGEPLEAGQTVYGTRDLEPVEIVSLRSKEYDGVRTVKCKDRTGFVFYAPDDLTHQRPVFDADGVPIKEGDTVYVAPFDDPLTVRGFAADGRVLMDYHSDDSFGYSPENLTHTKPDLDTWERIEEDAGKNPFDYCKDVGHRLDTCENAERFKSRDLVRRCCALAERGE